MGENFRKLKNKALRIRLFKSISAGVATGLTVAGVLRLLCNYEILTLPPPVPILIAVGAGAAVWLLVFLLLYKSDMAFAKSLDARFGLQERLQTMLEYRDGTGAMLEMQRRDANDVLQTIPAKRLRVTRWWLYCIWLLVGTAALVASFLLFPAPPEPPVVPEIPYEVDDIKLDALRELIEEVKASEMASPYREDVVASLETLLEAIPSATTVAQKDTLVGTAMTEISEATDNSSAAVELINALWRSESAPAKELALALNYYDWPQSNEWKAFHAEYTELQASFAHKSSTAENPDAEKMYKDTLLLLPTVAADITKAMSTAALPAADPLAQLLTRMASAKEEIGEDHTSRLYGFAVIAADPAFVTYEDLTEDVENTLNLLESDIFNALGEHADNTSTGENAILRLASIFECTAPQLERPNLFAADSDNNGSSSGSDPGVGPGASGDIVFGSDDLVLDPVTGEYVTYGEILAEYNKLMIGKLENGTYTEEEQKAIREYFDILYGGFKDKE